MHRSRTSPDGRRPARPTPVGLSALTAWGVSDLADTQLERVGAALYVFRDGMDDERYRQRVLAQVRHNLSLGSREVIAHTLALLERQRKHVTLDDDSPSERK